MASKLVSAKDPGLINTGIVKSLHPESAPLWRDGQNVVFEDGQVRKSPGYIEVFDFAVNEPPVMGLQDVLVSGVANLIFGDASRLYRFDGEDIETTAGFSGSVDRGAFQGSAFQDDAFVLQTEPRASLWSMESWGAWGLASNGIDNIQINKMAGAGFVNLGGSSPLRAEVIKKYKVYLLAFNTDLGGAYIEFCDTDNVEDWANGAAGFLYVRDLDSDIICACGLGDYIAFYSANTMGIVQYIGPDFYFGARKVLSGIGAVGKFSVVEHNNMNYGISFQGVWKTDATSFDYISPPLLREWMQENINWGQASKIASYNNEDRSLLEWGVPLVGQSENSITICYNYQTGGWTFKNYGITVGLKKNNFRFPIFGLADGSIHYGEYNYDANGLPLDAWVQTKPMPGDDEMLWKSIEYIQLNLHSIVGSGLYVQIGVQEDLESDITWSEVITPDSSSAPIFLDSFLDGRYVSLKLGSATLGSNWRFSGFDIFGAVNGNEV